MTEQVLITIQGMQVIDNEAIPSPELITTGTYDMNDGIHRVIYEEQLDETEEITTNCLLFSDDKVELKKDGEVQTHMVFEKDKKNLTYYQTPYGSISVEMIAREVEIVLSENEIRLHLEYGISMNEQHMAECALKIHIHPNLTV